jgi:hypothetical protein
MFSVTVLRGVWMSLNGLHFLCPAEGRHTGNLSSAEDCRLLTVGDWLQSAQFVCHSFSFFWHSNQKGQSDRIVLIVVYCGVHAASIVCVHISLQSNSNLHTSSIGYIFQHLINTIIRLLYLKIWKRKHMSFVCVYRALFYGETGGFEMWDRQAASSCKTNHSSLIGWSMVCVRWVCGHSKQLILLRSKSLCCSWYACTWCESWSVVHS